MDKLAQVELAHFSNVVELIYKGAVDPYAWNKTIPALANYMEASKAMLFTPTVFTDNGGFYFNHGIPETAMELWRTRYQPMDIWLAGILGSNYMVEGSTFTGEEIVPREELVQSVWYREFLSRFDIGQLLSNTIFGADSSLPHYTSFGLFRSLNEKTFDSIDKYKSSLLVPHISRALGVMVRLRNAECQLATSFTALDRLNQGILLLGGNGEITFCNKAACRILQREDGLRLQTVRGRDDHARLVAAIPYFQERLDAAIREVVMPDIVSTQHFSRAVLVERPSGRTSYTLNFSPLPPVNDFAVSVQPPKAIAFICDHCAPLEINRQLLKAAYGLTRAEIDAAEMISTGQTLEEISGENEISVNTLKTHLQHIYSKTNTNNRAELVRMLINVSGEHI